MIIFLLVAGVPTTISSQTGVTIHPVTEVSDSATVDINKFESLDLFNQSQFDLNVMMLGFNSSIINETAIRNDLIDWHAPISRYPEIYNGNPTDGIDFKMNYTINYDFTFLGTQDLLDYKNFIKTNGTVGQPYYDWPYTIDSLVNMPDVTDTAYYVRSENAETYLQTRYGDPLQHTVVVINTFTGYENSFTPYYYNTSYTDLDHPDFVGRRYSSTNQIAGGASNSRLLYVDYSAGPESYYRSNQPHEHITDYDLTQSSSVDQLNLDIADDIQSAIELKMLPSYIYDPIIPAETVKFEFILMNFEDAAAIPQLSAVPTSNYDYLSNFDPETVIKNFVGFNSRVNWTYDILGKLNWYDIPNMNQSMITAINTTSSEIASGPIMSVLDQEYGNIFSASNASVTIIPAFIWGMPELYGTDFGGVATGDNLGSFTYLIAAQSQYVASGTQYSLPWLTSPFTDTLSVGSSSWIGIYTGYFEGEIYQSEIDVSQGDNLTLEVMTPSNYVKYSNGQSYETVAIQTNLYASASTYKFNLTAGDIYNPYFWVFKNTGKTSSSFSMSMTAFRQLTYGYSRVLVHEGGHSVGVSHPHDGFSWEKYYAGDGYYGEYVDWLWDDSYSTMSYAASIPGFSSMDYDTIQRGFLPTYFEQLNQSYQMILDKISNLSGYVPFSVNASLHSAYASYQSATAAFQAGNYNQSVLLAMDTFTLFDQAEKQLLSSALTEISITGLDDLPSGDTIEYQLLISTGQSTTNSTNTAIHFTLEGQNWTDLVIILTYQNQQIYKYTGYTWESINIDLSDVIVAIPPSSTPTTLTSSRPDEKSGFFSNLPIPIGMVLMALSFMTVIIYRRKRTT